ncbi:hypothetical protein HYFRA_00002633 [Hymenoscyphus fraxineus]|uniref:Uncharacterized protein n=1 Tax=Hymenoscyphus fraxineus TaxID=746836 RepID=A0A9N9L659_9HELO|nr:hypothetical protein HYFRA_00002633 [Hymenoscyphus fraxineus]
MADQMIKDRQDAPIWNAIEASNYKQALKLVDKRLAKKPSDYLQALKIFIRARSPLASEQAAVLAHLEELPKRKQPLTDLEAIELYEEAFGEVVPEPQDDWIRIIGEARWQCVKAIPKNEDVSKKCFEACLEKNDIDHARQISNSLEKSFPSNHAYIFWNIATMFLYSVSSSYPEKTRKLWGTLAFAQIQKLAAATKSAADPKQLPLRSIHTPQELLLLHRITETLGKPEQRLEYLQDPNLGPESVIAKSEWQLWRFKLILLGEVKSWQELFDTTQSLLKRARTKDASGQLSETGFSDWIVWDSFIRSAIELQGHEYRAAVVAEVEAHQDPNCKIDKSWKRNASLAWVKISFANTNTFAPSSDSSQDRLPIIIKYLKQYGTATTAFTDLKPYVQQLNADERKRLLEILTQNGVFGDPGHLGYTKPKEGEAAKPEYAGFKTEKKLAEHINSYKLRYLLSCSLPEQERHSKPKQHAGPTEAPCISCSRPCIVFCSQCLGSFAVDATKLYLAAADGGRESWDLLPTDRHPADELVILAATCLIKLSMVSSEGSEDSLLSPKNSYILQAVALLEQAASISQPNSQIWFLLIRLYTYLGNGSLAMRAYHNLALKQVQLDTLSYTLFDRISSFHPHRFSTSQETTYRTPLESLEKQQKLYRGSRGQISRNTWLSYKHGSYNTIFELKEVTEKLECSFSAVMSVVEKRRINRLLPSKNVSDGGYDVLSPNPESLETMICDTNDYESFPDYEGTIGRNFEELSRFVPAPSLLSNAFQEYRTRLNLVSEKILQLFMPSTTTKSANQASLKAFLATPLEFPKVKDASTYLTKPENCARKFYEAISNILHSSLSSSFWKEQKFESRLEAHNEDLRNALSSLLELLNGIKDLTPAFGHVLHAIFTAHSLASHILSFIDFQTKIPSKEIHPSQLAANKKTEMLAREIIQKTLQMVGAIKKGMDEGGWIDRVLDSVTGAAAEGAGGVGELMDGGAMEMVGAIKKGMDEGGWIDRVLDSVTGAAAEGAGGVGELMDGGAMEVWAGDLVEGWRDGVVGLGLLKDVKG